MMFDRINSFTENGIGDRCETCQFIPAMDVLDAFSDVTPILESENADEICKIHYIPQCNQIL